MEPGLELFLFQEEGICFASGREGALIADEMGLGKPIQAIGVINGDSSIRKVIIVCPASMRIPWRREMERWLDRPLSIVVIGVNKGSPHDLFSNNVFIINYDRLTQFIRELSACFAIFAFLISAITANPLRLSGPGGSWDQGLPANSPRRNAHPQSSD